MVGKQPVAEQNLDGYGAPLISWATLRADLEEAFRPGTPSRLTSWLATVRPDGRPHVMPLGALWIDGAFYFIAGPGTRKARNLAHDPHCVITVGIQRFDVVAEGEGRRVTDPAAVSRVAEVYRSQGWQASVRGTGLYADYGAPSAGPPPWDVYEMAPQTIFAIGTAEPFGATRWRF